MKFKSIQCLRQFHWGCDHARLKEISICCPIIKSVFSHRLVFWKCKCPQPAIFYENILVVRYIWRKSTLNQCAYAYIVHLTVLHTFVAVLNLRWKIIIKIKFYCTFQRIVNEMSALKWARTQWIYRICNNWKYRIVNYLQTQLRQFFPITLMAYFIFRLVLTFISNDIGTWQEPNTILFSHKNNENQSILSRHSSLM